MVLLRICQPFEDEDFWDYVKRLAEINYYERPSMITEIAQMHKYKSFSNMVFSNDIEIVKISELSGVSEEKLRALLYPEIEGNKQYNLFSGMPVQRFSLKNSPSKVCPQCLKEHGCSRQIWNITAYTGCAVHHVRMIDTCPSCGNGLSCLRPKTCECRCGFDLTTIEGATLSLAEIDVCTHIYDLVYQNHREGGCLNHLKLGSYLKLLDFMAAQIAGVCVTSGNFLSTKTLEQGHEFVVQAHQIFTNWPNNFYKFLLELKGRNFEGSRYKRATGLVKDFGAFYIPLYEHFQSAEFDFLRDAFEENLTHWDGGYIKESNLAFSKKLQEKIKFIGINEAAAKLKMAPKRVKRLLETGYLQGNEIPIENTTIFRIDKSSVKELKDILETAISPRQVSKSLKISCNVVLELLRRDLLEPYMGKTVLDDDFKWLILPGTVDDFFNKIRSQIKSPTNMHKKFIDIKEAIHKLKPVKYGYPDLIAAIFAGDISPCAESEEQGLERFWFLEEDIRNFIDAKYAAIKNDSFSLEEAAAEMRVKIKTLRLWANKGLLDAVQPHTTGYSWWTIYRWNIDEFKEKYVLGAPIARSCGMSPGKLVKTLAQMEIYPVSGNTVDGGLQYLFRKSDLEQAGYDTSVSWGADGKYRSWDKDTCAS
ncbi:MAG: helix-turn-helix protein [Firmicutes bacterium]|nr:helix-turn-helix protein [Bacillota bacterium]